MATGKPNWIRHPERNSPHSPHAKLTGNKVFFVLALCKISICLFLLRLSQFNEIRKLLWALIFIIVLFTIPLWLVWLLQCHPIERYWHKKVSGTCFRRITIMRIFIIQGSFSIVTDFICAAFPAFLFRDLRISFKTKFALCLLMGLGIITASTCIVRTSMAYQVLSEDVSWIGVPAAISRIVEINLGNICACAPVLRPLWRYIHVRLKGGNRDDFVFRRASQPPLTLWFSRFWSSATTQPQRTASDRAIFSISGVKNSKSTMNNSSGQSIILPLQGITTEAANEIIRSHPRPTERDPSPGWPLQDLSEGGVQTRRATYEFMTNDRGPAANQRQHEVTRPDVHEWTVHRGYPLIGPELREHDPNTGSPSLTMNYGER